MEKLKPCPCGATPERLNVVEGSSCKWAFASGDCCGEWLVEFRTQYANLESEECYELAASAWNEASRAEGRDER